ncbi:hypothetical protein N9H39_07895 [Gammaproteobacteria bacterium]|nr:hypothetical protein [Gammaproteobacteria bacterium]
MMKFLDVRIDLGAETGQDTRTSVQATEGRLYAVRERIKETDCDSKDDEFINLLIEESGLLIELKKMDEAWSSAQKAFEIGTRHKQWQSAARACDLMFSSEQPLSLAALGQGIWLAVTFPVDVELTVSLLNHVIDETPDHSDGAAVAAATAVYVVDLRAKGEQYDELSVHTRQLMSSVARRHSGIENQLDLDNWVQRLELNDVGRILIQLRNVVDVLVQDNWWIDRDAIQSELPDQ